MHNEKIYLQRITRLIARLKDAVYTKINPLEIVFVYDPNPIAQTALDSAQWMQIKPGEKWGEAWGSAFFRITGTLSQDYPAEEQGLYFDCDGEACVFVNGSPWQGLTPKVDWYHNAAKYYVPLSSLCDKEGKFELLIEAAANDLFGSGKDDYHLRHCHLSRFEESKYQFMLDLELLNDLMTALPEGSVRRTKLLSGLNDICNVYASNFQAAQEIAQDLLAKSAHASALTAYSIGHAHLDLAWLWPLRESKRKGGRTFANALRMLDMYPQYVFGASQAQLYKWIKELYPKLYMEVQSKVLSGQWEVQGASWVEFDTNLISGESIIRQFRYGREFFAREFGIRPDVLWLPDCFGFSGNIPQIMKGCGVNNFMTQKLSWNETNPFGKHLFIWQGVDGTEVLAHQLPTHDYNFSNNPSAFLKTEARFTEAGIADAFLNLYGIGDGGGGPTRNHLEYGIRQQNLEGSVKFKFAKSEEFFAYYANLPREKLPKCYTELYLEFHRGTYTTQGRMKQYNVKSERLLRAAEAVNVYKALAQEQVELCYPKQLHPLWEDTLLLQFHDILPGSSITQVYDDADEICERNHAILQDIIYSELNTETKAAKYTLFNPSPGTVYSWLSFPLEYQELASFLDGVELMHRIIEAEELKLLVKLEAWSSAVLEFMPQFTPYTHEREEIVPISGVYTMRNNNLELQISPLGSILRIGSKDEEMITKESNRLLLWEDEPNNWGAWDINHYYRETQPQTAQQVRVLSAFSLGYYAQIVHEFRFEKSVLIQTMELFPEADYVQIRHDVDWHEHHKMLRAEMSANVFSQHAECGIQMAKISRKVRPQNAWDEARFEFPARGFVALSEGERTCALVSSEKFGYSALENKLEIALLRSPADVDPHADMGRHSYTYAIYAKAVSFAEADLSSLGESLGSQIYYAEGNARLPQSILSAQHLVISQIKAADRGSAIIVRLYEPLGRSCLEVVHTTMQISKIYKCNMLEEIVSELPLYEEFEVRPFEIVTLRLEL